MASPQIFKSSFSVSQSKSLLNLRCFCSEFNSKIVGKRIPMFGSHRSSKLILMNRRFTVCCKVEEGASKSNGDEPPESLFMKELKRRGMAPTSLLEESKRSIYTDKDTFNYRQEDGGFTNRNWVSADVEKPLFNQRERSMEVNSEVVEGFLPRAKLLLAIGGTFFSAFWLVILLTVASFCALYLYFGASFVHDGTDDDDTSVSPPSYVDQFALTGNQRIAQTAPRL